MYKIGEFSTLTKTTVKTLRFYDEADLLKPEYVDPYTGYRYYTTQQLNELQRLLALRQAGLTIEDVKKINGGASQLGVLNSRLGDMEKELSEAEQRRARLVGLINRIKENQSMEYQAIIKELPEYTVYYKQGVIKDFSGITEFILGSANECIAANPDIKCVEPDYCFVTYLDGEYKEKDINIEYAQAVTAAGKETDTIKFRRLKSGNAVCVYHKGSYSGLGKAYAFIFDWVEKNGYKAVEFPRERYIDGMWNKETEDEWLTEIQIPVVKA